MLTDCPRESFSRSFDPSFSLSCQSLWSVIPFWFSIYDWFASPVVAVDPMPLLWHRHDRSTTSPTRRPRATGGPSRPIQFVVTYFGNIILGLYSKITIILSQHSNMFDHTTNIHVQKQTIHTLIQQYYRSTTKKVITMTLVLISNDIVEHLKTKI